MPYFYTVFDNANASENEILYAAAAFDDIFEFCSIPVYFVVFIIIKDFGENYSKFDLKILEIIIDLKEC